MIAEMADLFGVSLDALVGFEAQNNGVIALKDRIQELQREKRYEEAITEAEKALLRYPNDFRIVYHSGMLCAVAGIEQNKENYLHSTHCLRFPNNSKGNRSMMTLLPFILLPLKS